MRKVTKEAATALLKQKNYRNSNTEVHSNGQVMALHGNTIAMYDALEGTLTVRDAGWQTVTTKERINGVLEVFGINTKIVQSNHQWYILSEQGYRTPWHGFVTLKVD